MVQWETTREALVFAYTSYLYANTRLNPIAVAITAIMGVALLLLPRRYAIIPILIVTLFITELQRIVVFSLNFSMLRTIVVIGWIRVCLRNEVAGFKLRTPDILILTLMTVQTTIYILLWRTQGAVINALGGAFDLVGIYFLFRVLLKSIDEANFVILSLAVIIVPLAIEMLQEQITGQNIFHAFGGVPRFTEVREGRLRSQGAFIHAILAGTFGATVFPIFIGAYKYNPGARGIVFIGIASAAIITITSFSSGPLFAFLVCVIGLLLWPWSKYMREIRYLFVIQILGLSLFMKAPVYALVARFSLVGGSTGEHRYMLIDQFFKRFNEWWLLGARSTAHWGRGLADVTSQYIRIAVNGGLASLIVFLLLIIYAYREIGWSLKKLADRDSKDERYLVWTLGVAISGHVISFLSVSYFDQIVVMWYLVLAMVLTVNPKEYRTHLRQSVA